MNKIMGKLRKTLTKAAAAFSIAALALTAVPFSASASEVPLRIAGNTAIDTAVEISKQTGWSGAAILAPAGRIGSMGDALAAGPLSFVLKAPILLNEAGSPGLHPETRNELARLGAKTVYITSGTAVIPQSVLNEISSMGIETVSLGGYDRAETSVNIAKRLNNVTKVAVANSVADALSIAAIASAANQPILLVDRNNVSKAVTDYLAANPQITSTDIIGGTGTISAAVANQFPGSTRHFGQTAYDTNNQVIQNLAASLNFNIVYTANGRTAIDALSGAPLAAVTNSPIVLTDGVRVPETARFIAPRLGGNGQVTALGGLAAIPESVRTGVGEGNVTLLVRGSQVIGVNDYAAEVLRLTNNERAARGLSALSGDNSTLGFAAMLRAEEITRTFSHTRPDGRDYNTAYTDLSADGSGRTASIAENIASGYSTPQSVVNGWMTSPGHRANILNPSYTHLGVGVSRSYWVQLFYRR